MLLYCSLLINEERERNLLFSLVEGSIKFFNSKCINAEKFIRESEKRGKKNPPPHPQPAKSSIPENQFRPQGYARVSPRRSKTIRRNEKGGGEKQRRESDLSSSRSLMHSRSKKAVQDFAQPVHALLTRWRAPPPRCTHRGGPHRFLFPSKNLSNRSRACSFDKK